MKSMASEIGCTSSTLDHTHPTLCLTDLGEGKFARQISVNSITDASTIIFSTPLTDDLIDLQEIYVLVHLKV